MYYLRKPFLSCQLRTSTTAGSTTQFWRTSRITGSTCCITNSTWHHTSRLIIQYMSQHTDDGNINMDCVLLGQTWWPLTPSNGLNFLESDCLSIVKSINNPTSSPPKCVTVTHNCFFYNLTTIWHSIHSQTAVHLSTIYNTCVGLQRLLGSGAHWITWWVLTPVTFCWNYAE